MSSTAENKDVVRRWIQAMNDRDFDAAAALMAENLVNHGAVPEAQGVAGFRRIMKIALAAMPDQRLTCEDMIAEGDRVVCRVTVEGTQTGPLAMTRISLPASHRSCKSERIHICRVQGGKIIETWVGRDDLGMLRQLGHLPFGNVTTNTAEAR